MERRRFAFTCMIALLAIAAFALFLVLEPGDEAVSRLVTGVIVTAAPLAAAVACLLAARTPGRTRRAWLLLAASACSWGLAHAAWSWSVATGGVSTTFPSPVDVGFLAAAPLPAAAVLAFAERGGTRSMRVRLGLDCAVVAGSLFLIALPALLADGGPLAQPRGSAAAQAVALSYPLGDLLAGTLVGLVAGRSRREGRLALGLLGAGLAALVLADGAFAWLVLTERYAVSHLSAAGWCAAFALLGLAALAPAGPAAPAWGHDVEEGRAVLLPYVLFLLAMARCVETVVGGGALTPLQVCAAFVVLVAVMSRLLFTMCENRRLLTELQVREEHFRSLVHQSSDVITLVSPDGTVRYQSPAITRLLGYAPDELVGRTLVTLLHPEDVDETLAALRDPAAAGIGPTITARLRHARGGWRHVESTVTYRGSAGLGGLVLTTRDVSARKNLERRLSHQAFHDALTGLANRAQFTERADEAIARHRDHRTGLGVLFVDLDDFKGVNDSLGHVVGDELLVAAAGRLSTLSRPGDTVARLGGDEFALLIPDVGAAELAVVAGRIAEAFSRPFALAGRSVIVGASIGLATADADVRCAADLLRNADLAMYRAKRRGKGRCEPFERSLHHEALARLELEADLRRALEAMEFTVHYQPIVSLADGRIAGVEALVRWRHPSRGMVAPEAFVGVAEDTGLITAIGRRVLSQACRQVRAWQERIPGCAHLSVSVNLSARELRDPGLDAAVTGCLATSGLAARDLILEITESALLEDTEDTLARLARLRALGIRLAIDDFGTGWSSLAYLRRFPVDVLKVDRSFVIGVAGDPDAAALLGAILGLGRTLRLRTVAEGVECEAELRVLERLGCELGQGHHLARPEAAGEVESVLRRRRGVSPGAPALPEPAALTASSSPG